MTMIKQLPLEALEFLEVLAIERNYSQNTVLSYRRNLNQFFKWLDNNNLQSDVTCLEPITIRSFISFLKREIKNISIKQKLATLKSFFKYLEEIYEVTKLPAIPKHMKKERVPIETISVQEMHILLDAVSKRKNELLITISNRKKNISRLQKQIINCKRDHAILALLSGTGIRVGELTAINVDDINLHEKTIVIHGKRNKIREVFFDVPLIENPLIEYLIWRTSVITKVMALFLNSKDNQGITTRSIQRMLKIYVEISGISLDLTPHILRHSYASISIEKGANIKAISQLLGHAQVSTTLEYYTHLSKEHLRKVYKETHPGSQSNKSLHEIMNERKSIITSL
jgi:site-specific recombinase XerD